MQPFLIAVDLMAGFYILIYVWMLFTLTDKTASLDDTVLWNRNG